MRGSFRGTRRIYGRFNERNYRNRPNNNNGQYKHNMSFEERNREVKASYLISGNSELSAVAFSKDILNKNTVINESKSFTCSLDILNNCFFDPSLYHEPFSILSSEK